MRVENGKWKVGRAARPSFNTTTYFYLDGRGDLWSPVARQKVTFTPTRANTVRPYGRDKDFLFGLHTEVHFLTVTTLDRRGRRSLQSGRMTDGCAAMTVASSGHVDNVRVANYASLPAANIGTSTPTGEMCVICPTNPQTLRQFFTRDYFCITYNIKDI